MLYNESLVLFEAVMIVDLGDGALLGKYTIWRDDKLCLSRIVSSVDDGKG